MIVDQRTAVLQMMVLLTTGSSSFHGMTMTECPERTSLQLGEDHPNGAGSFVIQFKDTRNSKGLVEEAEEE